MTAFQARVRQLNRASWQLRRAAPKPVGALPPFALAIFTDERTGIAPEQLARALPPATGMAPVAVIYRHYQSPRCDRLAVARRLAVILHRKGHVLLTARLTSPAADGIHSGAVGTAHKMMATGGLTTAPCHTLCEGMAASRRSAGLVFLSAIFPTRSHGGKPGLGPARAALMAAQMRVPAFALGGINARRLPRLLGGPIYGIGVIDAVGTP